MDLSTHYEDGQKIHAGDHVKIAGQWDGVVVFVIGTNEELLGYKAEDWRYLGAGFMVNTKQASLVFYESSDQDDFVLVSRNSKVDW